MKREAAVTITIAALYVVLLCPRPSQAQDAANSNTASAAQSESMKMVSARAELVDKLDARKMQPGKEFRVTLDNSVRLDNGTRLPRGTKLIGTVATADAQSQGTSQLALRFSQAELRDGKVVPIKATITSIYTVSKQENEFAPQGQQADPKAGSNPWTPGATAFDQTNALHDVDLHSRVDSNNSGVLVSTEQDFTVSPGTELVLALTAAA